MERVGPRREDGDVDVQLLVAEEHLRALRAADPVALDRLRPLRPVDQLQVLQQLVRVGRDAEEPLLHVHHDDLCAAPLAVPVDHVLVGDDGLVVRAPVDGRLPPVRKARLEELQEEPLRPAVVLRLVCADLAIPVDHPAQPAHLAADVLDVALDDLARMAALANRGVLSRQTEGVPTHRAQDVPAVSAPVMREDVAQCVVEDVTHVQRAGRVRQHLEHVELPLRLGSGLGVRGIEGPLGLPDRLPFRLDCLRVVLVHTASGYKKASHLERPGEARAAGPRWLPALQKELLHCPPTLAS